MRYRLILQDAIPKNIQQWGPIKFEGKDGCVSNWLYKEHAEKMGKVLTWAKQMWQMETDEGSPGYKLNDWKNFCYKAGEVSENAKEFCQQQEENIKDLLRS